jgi:hypothetical protein
MSRVKTSKPAPSSPERHRRQQFAERIARMEEAVREAEATGDATSVRMIQLLLTAERRESAVWEGALALIRAGFAQRARAQHPDAGGTGESFQVLTEARDWVLERVVGGLLHPIGGGPRLEAERGGTP